MSKTPEDIAKWGDDIIEQVDNGADEMKLIEDLKDNEGLNMADQEELGKYLQNMRKAPDAE